MFGSRMMCQNQRKDIITRTLVIYTALTSEFTVMFKYQNMDASTKVQVKTRTAGTDKEYTR